MNARKLLPAAAVIVGIGAGAGYVALKTEKAGETPAIVEVSPSPTATPTGPDIIIPSASPTPTATPVSVLTVVSGEASIMGESGLYQVKGEIKNNDKVAHSALLKAVLTDASGKITGVLEGPVNDVPAGKSALFTLVTDQLLEQSTNVKVTVTEVLK